MNKNDSLTDTPKPFWEIKTFEQMSDSEWESLCDGCGLCCLHKLEDKDTGEIFYTSVACWSLDLDRCKCITYNKRHELVHDCLVMDRDELKKFHWLPSTCAYRLIAEGKPLPWWHPLVSGDPDTVHTSGISLKDKAISEKHINIEDLEAYILDVEI